MTPTPYAPGMPTHSEMSAPPLADYRRRIRLTRSVPALHALAHEIQERFPREEVLQYTINRSKKCHCGNGLSQLCLAELNH